MTEANIWFFRQDEDDELLLHEIEDTEHKAIIDTLLAHTTDVDINHTKWGMESYSDWPSLLDDMRSLSRIHKDIVIKLFYCEDDVPEGEMMFFKAGGVQVAQSAIIYDGFDPEKLEYAEEELV